jgi:hypothetical protein
VKTRARFSPADPRRAKPKGATSGRRTNPVTVARDSRKGKPRNRGPLGRPTAICGGITGGLNGMWVLPLRKRGGYLPRGESSEGRIPRAPPV